MGGSDGQTTMKGERGCDIVYILMRYQEVAVNLLLVSLGNCSIIITQLSF